MTGCHSMMISGASAVGEVLTFHRGTHVVACLGCGRAFRTADLPLCASCDAEADAAIDAWLEESARAAGFASFEDWTEAEYRRSMAAEEAPC